MIHKHIKNYEVRLIDVLSVPLMHYRQTLYWLLVHAHLFIRAEWSVRNREMWLVCYEFTDSLSQRWLANSIIQINTPNDLLGYVTEIGFYGSLVSVHSWNCNFGVALIQSDFYVGFCWIVIWQGCDWSEFKVKKSSMALMSSHLLQALDANNLF